MAREDSVREANQRPFRTRLAILYKTATGTRDQGGDTLNTVLEIRTIRVANQRIEQPKLRHIGLGRNMWLTGASLGEKVDERGLQLWLMLECGTVEIVQVKNYSQLLRSVTNT